ncbi:MAG: hypothetical protein WB581_10925, partial [Halobacteriota archaeon]
RSLLTSAKWSYSAIANGCCCCKFGLGSSKKEVFPQPALTYKPSSVAGTGRRNNAVFNRLIGFTECRKAICRFDNHSINRVELIGMVPFVKCGRNCWVSVPSTTTLD